MKSQAVALLAALLLGQATSCLAGLLEREVIFSEAQIQQALVKAGPQQKNYGGLLTVALAEAPRIKLGEPAGRVGIAARIDITLLGNPTLPVDVTGTAGIRYDDTAKAFFLERPETDSIVAQGLAKESEPTVRRTVNGLLNNYFRSKPLYTLRDNGTAEELAARWLLRSVRIEPGKVVATLSPF